MSTAINYYYNNKIDNENLYFYIIYCDIWEYNFKISKGVNRFIRKNDTLKFKHSKSVKKEKLEKLYFDTYFYNIYCKARNLELFKKPVDEESILKLNKIIKKRKLPKGYAMWKECNICNSNCILANKCEKTEQ